MRVAKLMHEYEDRRQLLLQERIAFENQRIRTEAEPERLPELISVLGALASNPRLRIMGHLSIHPDDVTAIAKATRLSVPAASRHIGVLALHSLVAYLPNGNHRQYHVSQFVEAIIVGRTLELRIERGDGQRVVLAWMID